MLSCIITFLYRFPSFLLNQAVVIAVRLNLGNLSSAVVATNHVYRT